MFQFNQGRISSQAPNPEDTSRICINNCGMHLIQEDSLEEYRRSGRGDFQLLYIVEGEAVFTVREQSLLAAAGTLVLYKPFEPQKYVYTTQKKIQVYWIHFFGEEFEQALKNTPLYENGFFQMGISYEIIGIFEKIIRYMQSHMAYELMCCGYFFQILALIDSAVRLSIEEDAQSLNIRKNMEKVIELIHSNCAEEHTIEEMAALCYLSKSYFFRVFKQLTGKSPRHYRLTIQIEQTKYYLASTNLPVSVIAQNAGFSDPLYFSRIFKKHTGLSPRDYRKQTQSALSG